MLDNHYSMRDTEQQANIMENRLRRLEMEEAKAEKNRIKTEKKAKMMLDNRARHYNDLMNKIKHIEE